MIVTGGPEAGAAVVSHERRGGLALTLQEAFTVLTRLRSNRQVAADAGQFRSHIKGLLGRADADARALGYAPADVKLAIYAFVAFLDESVLRSPQAIFRDWAGQPLQEEVFGDHMAGENFFRNLGEIMHRPDSEALADLLEVHQTCLLLGFKGRYGGHDDAALAGTIASVDERIARIRGRTGDFGRGWVIPDETIPVAADPWVRRLMLMAGVCVAVLAAFWLLYRTLLGSTAGQLSTFLS